MTTNDFKLNSKVSWEYSKIAMSQNNLAPGRVVNMFASLATILLAAGRGAKGLAYARQCFEAVFPGAHEKGKAYKNLPVLVDKNGNVHQYVADSVVKAQFALMREMELSAENIMGACFDIQTIARMYVEDTIDAAKTGLQVVVQNAEGFLNLRAQFKAKTKVSFDWKNGKANVSGGHQDISKGEAANGAMEICDISAICRNITMRELDVYAKEASSHIQSFSADFLGWCRDTVAKTKSLAERSNSVKLIAEFAQDLNEIRETRQAEIRKDKDLEKEEKKVRLAALRQEFNEYYEALRKTLRGFLKEFPDWQRAALAIAVTFDGKDGDEDNWADYARQLLDREFLGLIEKATAKKLNNATETEDRLEVCVGMEEEETIELKDGVFMSEDGTKQVAAEDDTLEGTFKVVKTERGWAVRRPIAEILEAQAEKEETLGNVMIVGARKKYSDEELASVDAKLKPGDLVQLLPAEGKYGDFNVDLSINGERLVTLRTYKFVDKKDGESERKAMYWTMNRFPRREGTFVTSVRSVPDDRKEAMPTMFFVLKDVHPISR